MRPTELEMQKSYQMAVDEWIVGINAEKALALGQPNVREVETWEAAHFKEEGLRNKAMQAKKDYEDAIRQNLFDF
jgi:HJR/Mrr/RecB family endonuclease